MVMSDASSRIEVISSFLAESMVRTSFRHAISGEFPGAVWLQTADEMVVLGVHRRSTRPDDILNVFALLLFTNKFFDQSDGSRIPGTGVTPGGCSSDGFAVDLIGDGTADHIEVLLCEGDVRLPGRE